MPDILKALIMKAQSRQKKILFPEAGDQRVLQALAEIIRQGICHPVILGDAEKIRTGLRHKGLHRFSLSSRNRSYTVISPTNPLLRQQLAKKLFQLRKKKGLTEEQATELIQKPNYFAIMCLATGLADGMVSGAATTTADVLRPALQIIRTTPGTHASGAFLLIPKDRAPLLFADCAVTPDPTSSELAKIAFETSKTAKLLGMNPRLALLSFSSHGSAKHLPQSEKVIQALKILKKSAPKLRCDGELQVDAALDKTVAKLKTPTSPLHGEANILIFPNLDAGNIGYKLVERLAHAQAIGTIVQGLKKPVNDLSRGCQAADIVYLTAITVLQTLK